MKRKQQLDRQKFFPNLFRAVDARAKKRKVFESLNNRTWVSDIRGALTVQVLIEYINLWELFSNVELQPDVEDTHIWQFSQNQHMKLFFIGAVQFRLWERIWQSWPLASASFSYG